MPSVSHLRLHSRTPSGMHGDRPAGSGACLARAGRVLGLLTETNWVLSRLRGGSQFRMPTTSYCAVAPRCKPILVQYYYMSNGRTVRSI